MSGQNGASRALLEILTANAGENESIGVTLLRDIKGILILARLTRFPLLSWWNTSSETVASLSALRRVVDAFTGLYLGASPKGSVIISRDIGTQELYSLSVRFHD